ncbi:hypothetical protein ALC56_12977 [Trachymyrmex septentrionalis]|uniref:Uncharacterized protein n=1 Tax=Trachymyrmex septentrionalis TaxID=34720 RepID=A0A195EWU8_9HYME|nr:PREDICTED: uncharacterized protein LOC108754202 [Trachymyrmex septentrionalis]KYN32698.1 hypothetical protein ALC56_12977 [Trachymyrmex septentrionalis]
MTDSANKDSIIKLNTQLNKSVILIENAEDMPSSNRKRKSITIKTEEQPSKVRSSPVKSRKSILKKSNKSLDKNVANDEIVNTSNDANRSEVTFNELSLSTSVLSRPHTLNEMVEKEAFNEENVSSTFNLEDVSDSEEIWIMDMPRLVDPQDLHGQTIVFEDKSKFKIKDKRYCIVAHNTNHNVTCVLNSKKDAPQYKTVNIKPAGFLAMRRKLSEAPEVKPISTKSSAVQFPDNLRTRHPLFGVIHKHERSSKKLRRNSVKTS